ncbi:TetR/AcrR family transcriptional regulator [Angustibacter luteus]
MITLVAAKPYDAITVEDITEYADVARATFYAHVKDKPALLLEVSQQLVAELTERAQAVAAPEPPVYTGGAVFTIFDQAARHRALYRLVISGEGGSVARTELVAAFERLTGAVLTRMVAAPAHEPRVPMDVITTAYVGAILLTLERWLGEHPDADSTDPGSRQVATDFLRSQVGGLEWSLGYQPGEARFERA